MLHVTLFLQLITEKSRRIWMGDMLETQPDAEPLKPGNDFHVYKYSPTSPPIPYSEKDVTKVWQDEEWDANLPQPGFLTDLVLTTRGIETPTKFAIWSGIFAISTILKRDAYLNWGFKPLYPNMYIILVAPPRMCAKSTVIDICEDIFLGLDDLLKSVDLKLAFRKKLNLHHSK